MDWFKTVKGYYDAGFYMIEQMKIFVQKSKITAVQFKEITGQDYTV
jgi:uncharacterized XkdX family phage protein